MHPTTAALVVEVAHRSIHHDRMTKLRLYAACGIPEYWIVDLAEGKVEVYREPAGNTYQDMRYLDARDVVAPLGRPDARIPVDDVLP